MEHSPASLKTCVVLFLGLLITTWPASAQKVVLRIGEETKIADLSSLGLRSDVAGLPPGLVSSEPFYLPDAAINSIRSKPTIRQERVMSAILSAVPTPLGGADTVAILGATTVTNTGLSVVSGDLALTPGTSVTGFPPGMVINGAIHINDAFATQAHAGALNAYNLLAAEVATTNLSGMNLGGLTLMPGTYRFDNAAQLSGTLRLDTGGDPTAAFHFQIGTMLTTDPMSSISLLNGNSVNLFWQVGTSATLGAGSAFVGTIIANQSITLNSGASLDGRALALNGAVTLDTNAVTVPTPTPTPVPTPPPTPTPVPTPTPIPTATPVPTPTPIPTATPVPTPTPIPTATPVPTPTPIPTATPVPTATPIPTATPSPTATPVPTPTPRPTATPSPGVTPSPTPGVSPSPTPGGMVQLTPNQLAVLQALNVLVIQQPGNPLIQLLAGLPPAQLPGALDLLTPEQLTSIFISDFAVLHIEIDNIEHRLWDVRQGTPGFTNSGFAVVDNRASTRPADSKDSGTWDGKDFAPATPAVSLGSNHRWGFFISGTGEVVDVETTSAAHGYSFNTGGVTIGADYRLTDHFVLGAAVDYANISADLNLGGRLRNNEGRSSVYGTYYNGGFYLNGVLGAGYSSLDTRRLTIGGFARGDTNAADFNALLGTGYDFHSGGFTFGPIASLRYGRVGIDGFTEEGALGSLRIRSQSEDSLLSTLGLQASYTIAIGHIPITPFVRAQWEHEYKTSTPSIDASFTPTDIFTVQGPHLGRNGALLDAGISAQLTPTIGIFTYYTGELGRENYNVQSITAGIRFSF